MVVGFDDVARICPRGGESGDLPVPPGYRRARKLSCGAARQRAVVFQGRERLTHLDLVIGELGWQPDRGSVGGLSGESFRVAGGVFFAWGLGFGLAVGFGAGVLGFWCG